MGPTQQAVQRRNGATADHIEAVVSLILRAATNHVDPIAQTQVRNRLNQEGMTSQERFQERNPQIRAQHRERDPGKTGAASDVDDRGVRRQQRGGSNAVEDVPLPDPIGLTGSDQASLDARTSQYVDIATNQRIAGAEHITGDVRNVHPALRPRA